MTAARKLTKFIKPYWKYAALAPLMMVLEVTMDLLQPRMVQRIIDEGVTPLDLDVVLHTGLLMFGLALIGAIGGMGCGFFAEMTSQNFSADLREELFRKVQSFSFSNLDDLDTGQLITRLTNDVTQVQEAIMMMLRMMIRSPLLLIGSVVMAIITSPQLAWLPLILLPIELVVVIYIVRRTTPMFTRVQERLDALNEVTQENLAGIRVVKAFVRALHEQSRFGQANLALTDQAVQAGRTVAIMPAFMMMTMNLGIVAVLWFGGIRVIGGSMQLGQVIAFINYLTTTLFSLVMVSNMVMQMARAEASAKRIQEVLEMQPRLLDREGAGGAELRGEVVFENVSFYYNGDSSNPTLKSISFDAEPGQTVALLGATGSGKSSLVNLIPRFYDVTGGRVMVDGMDVRDLDQDLLRRQIGVALQDTVLFSGTIRDNIRYGRPDAGDDKVIAAAMAAQAHDFIMALPDGYDTQLGQRGVNLSGGQKQRIAIARAILIDPTILILDDSTSAVDVETESKIQQALEALHGVRTTFVIAQRISTVLNADKILVLDDGQIAAEGTHHELLESSPIYQEIFESQLREGVIA